MMKSENRSIDSDCGETNTKGEQIMKVSILVGIAIVLILGMQAIVGSADPYYGLVVGRNPYSFIYPTDCCYDYSCCNCCICEPEDCNDGNPCTIDSCTSDGCVHEPVFCKENMHLGVDAWYGEYWFTEIFKPKWPQRV